MSKYYLAYGSNLNKRQMAYRCPNAVPVGVAIIPDYALVFRRGYLTIEPKAGGCVPVGVWEITEEDEKALDHYEGFPKFYFKQDFRVEVNGDALDCMAYIMTDGHPIQAPSADYLGIVDHGYADFGFGVEQWRGLMEAYIDAKRGPDHTTVSTTKDGRKAHF